MVFMQSILMEKSVLGDFSFSKKSKQRTLVHIISDNKKYRDDAIDFVELIPMIYGEVVWRSNNFKDIDFLKYETKNQIYFMKK